MPIVIHYINFIIIFKYICIISHPLTQEPKIKAASNLPTPVWVLKGASHKLAFCREPSTKLEKNTALA